MSDIKELLERQERWQRSRAGLSWFEKLRLAETLRDAALAMGCERKEPRRFAVLLVRRRHLSTRTCGTGQRDQRQVVTWLLLCFPH